MQNIVIIGFDLIDRIKTPIMASVPNLHRNGMIHAMSYLTGINAEGKNISPTSLIDGKEQHLALYNKAGSNGLKTWYLLDNGEFLL